MSYQKYSPTNSTLLSTPHKPAVLHFEDLAHSTSLSTNETHLNQNGSSYNDDVRQKLYSLRQENSSLVSQSHRLLGELEDTSHQLLQANRKVEELKAGLEVGRGQHHTSKQLLGNLGNSSNEKYGSRLGGGGLRREENEEDTAHLKNQVTSLKDKLNQSLVLNEELRQLCVSRDRERNQWKKEESTMHDQLEDLLEERKRLMQVWNTAEKKASNDLEVHSIESSEVSWPSPVRHPRTHGKQEAYRNDGSRGGCGISQPLPSLQSKGYQTRDPVPLHQPPNQQAFGRRLFGSMGLESSKRSSDHDGSRSMPPMNTEPLYRHHDNHEDGLVRKYSDQVSENGRLRQQLETERQKLLLSEKEISFLEKELREKSELSRSHTEEVSHLKVKLAECEKEWQRQIEEMKRCNEVEKEKVLQSSSEKLGEVEVQLRSSQMQLECRDAELQSLKSELKERDHRLAASTKRCEELESEVEKEREARVTAVQKFSNEVHHGSSVVSNLEKSLESCQGELREHLLRVQEDAVQQERVLRAHQKEVTGLNSLLAEARSELVKHQSLAKKVQHDLEGARRELSFRQESEGKLQAELEICCNKLKQTDEEKLKLQNELIQVDIRLRSSKEAETRKEGEIQRKLNGIENKYGEVLKDLERTRRERDELKKTCTKQDIVKTTLERRLTDLAEEMDRLKAHLEECRRKEREMVSKLHEAEGKVKEREADTEATTTKLQEELAKRALQVSELDTLLRNHQADTAARRLKLERALAQRQDDLRVRTQRVEELTEKLRRNEKSLEDYKLQMKEASIDAIKQMEQKTSKIDSLQQALNKAQSEVDRETKEKNQISLQVDQLKEQVSLEQKAKVTLEKRLESLSAKHQKEIDKMTRAISHLKEQHSQQLHQLQESHAHMLSSHSQHEATYRQQLQKALAQDKRGTEELARYRAQLAALSSELAAEKKINEKYQQEVALASAEAARYQAQVSSLQRAISLKQYNNQLQALSVHTAPAADTSLYGLSVGSLTTDDTQSSKPNTGRSTTDNIKQVASSVDQSQVAMEAFKKSNYQPAKPPSAAYQSIPDHFVATKEPTSSMIGLASLNSQHNSLDLDSNSPQNLAYSFPQSQSGNPSLLPPIPQPDDQSSSDQPFVSLPGQPSNMPHNQPYTSFPRQPSHLKSSQPMYQLPVSTESAIPLQLNHTADTLSPGKDSVVSDLAEFKTLPSKMSPASLTPPSVKKTEHTTSMRPVGTSPKQLGQVFEI